MYTTDRVVCTTDRVKVFFKKIKLKSRLRGENRSFSESENMKTRRMDKQ